MEIILIILTSILLTVMSIGFIVLGYFLCELKHKKEAEKLAKENKEYEDRVKLSKNNKQYFTDLAKMLGYQGKEMSNDGTDEERN